MLPFLPISSSPLSKPAWVALPTYPLVVPDGCTLHISSQKTEQKTNDNSNNSNNNNNNNNNKQHGIPTFTHVLCCGLK